MPKSKLEDLFTKAPNKAEVDELLSAVTNDMIAALEKFEKDGETPPWVKPWDGVGRDVIMGGNRYPVSIDPRNVCSPKRVYTCIFNHFFLAFAMYIMQKRGRVFKTNFWITPKRVKAIGAKVKKGAMPGFVFKSLPSFKSSRAISVQPLYHVEDIIGYPKTIGMYVVEKETPAIKYKDAEKFKRLLEHGPEGTRIKKSMGRACYSPSEDKIYMPSRAAFNDKSNKEGKSSQEAEANYWATFLHECIHWTGHENRLDRFKKSNRLKDGRIHYAEEELVAEMGAAYLCPYLGVRNEIQHPEYIASWIGVLKSSGGRGFDHPLVKASKQATEASTYLIDLVRKKREIESPPQRKRKSKRFMPMVYAS